MLPVASKISVVMLFLLMEGDDKLIERMLMNYCYSNDCKFLEEQFVQKVLLSHSSLKLVDKMKEPRFRSDF